MSEKKTLVVLKCVPNIVLLILPSCLFKVPHFEVLTCGSKHITLKTLLKTLI